MAEEKQKSEIVQKEEEILKFWETHKIFETSLHKKSPKGEFVFYDGPPFATGLPHYGHILPGTIKDVIPRYKTMQGYRVRRKWGWDCHGLPVENIIEQELGLKTKKDIEKFGIAAFNEKARDAVLRYTDDWRRIIPRTGRWVDMENDYRTMDWQYMESIWWIFKTLYDKKLAYEDFKSMHICPRCETTLSNFEVSQGYKTVTDISVTVKFLIPACAEASAGRSNSQFPNKSENPNSQTYLLAWTTTPWTLPGNAALAVNQELTYCKVKIQNAKDNEHYVVAKERAPYVFGGRYEVVEEFSGKELIGKRYSPPFDYSINNQELENKENGWKIYGADFVTTDEGTGIVHIAPAFGEDDMALSKKYNLPFIQHVGMNGAFRDEVADFSGMQVKSKDNPQQSDIEIIKYLEHKGALFSKEKISHPYPHCWRCDTPLLNYAASSWFVSIAKIKDKLIRENKGVSWVPYDMRDGRFGKWLEGARDWAISRSRFWGAPIPVWKCAKCEAREAIGSFEELKKKMETSGNTYYIMRHGESVSNVEKIVNGIPNPEYPLTPKGREDVRKVSEALKSKNIDIIFYSPLERTKETALIIAKKLGVAKENLIEVSAIRETNVGVCEEKSLDDYHSYFSSLRDKFRKHAPEGETLIDIKKRVTKFLFDIDSKYSHKKILIISHADPLWMLAAGAEGADIDRALALRKNKKNITENYIEKSEMRELVFTPYPHDETFTVDFHRPYIDEVSFSCVCGGIMTRINDVFDCWFESGAMPYGQFHYPFENKNIFDPKKGKGFPADFIAESLDQTRGWFYSLLVLGVALFGKSPYKNVIVSGLVLGEDGKKMSKRLRNYPELTNVLEKYGADSLRYYLISSPLVRADTINFSEKGVREAQNKIIGRFLNICFFFTMYNQKQETKSQEYKITSGSILDRWILVRLSEVAEKVTHGLESYELDKALRPIAQFVDDFSTWYIRRSRERFKSDDEKNRYAAMNTTRYVLMELSKIMAPFLPFAAEGVYRKIRGENDPLSVHLAQWPEVSTKIPVWPNVMALVHRIFGTHKELNILTDMQKVRDIVSLSLEARLKAGIKVRQPIKELRIKKHKSSIGKDEELLQLIKDEVNVKEIIFDSSLQDDVEIDTEITVELQREGQLRELVRGVQELRKKKGLMPSEKITMKIKTDKSGMQFIKEHENELKKITSLEVIEFAEIEGSEQIVIGELTFNVLLLKI